jgi:hypothetical protein
VLVLVLVLVLVFVLVLVLVFVVVEVMLTTNSAHVPEFWNGSEVMLTPNSAGHVTELFEFSTCPGILERA